MIRYFALTVVGLHRDNNQDSYLCINNEYGDFLAVICDGIGGASAGDVASKTMVEYLKNDFSHSGPFNSLDDARLYIYKLLKAGNKYIYNMGQDNPLYFGMGTTLTGVFISNFGQLSLNVGDSRVYGFLNNKYFHLTFDDTLVNQMLQKKEISLFEADNHPKKHYLTKAIGIWPNVEFDIHEIKKMDSYVICSDGLCGFCLDDEILNIMNKSILSVDEKCQELMNLALLKGGYDNITIIVIDHENS